ncbi:MAG: sensor histidine kinase [Bacteroidota bacterium]
MISIKANLSFLHSERNKNSTAFPLIRGYLIVFYLLLSGYLVANDSYIDLATAADGLDLMTQCRCLVTEEKDWAVADVAASKDFQTLTEPFAVDYKTIVWLHCHFKNTAPQAVSRQLEVGNIGHSELYRTPQTAPQRNGYLVKYTDRRQYPSPYRFELKLSSNEAIDTYLRLSHFSVFNTQVKVAPRLWHQNSDNGYERQAKNYWLGLLCGIFFAFFGYALSIYRFNKAKYLWYWMGYIFFCFWYILFEIEIDPNVNILFSHFPNLFLRLNSVLSQLSVIFYILFFRAIIQLKLHLPKLDFWLKRLVYLLWASTVLDVVLNFGFSEGMLAYYSSLAVRLIALFVGIYSVVKVWQLKIPLSKLVAIGTAAWLIGTALFVLATYDIVTIQRNWLLPYSHIYLQIGTLVELSLFALAISKKQHQVTIEKVQTEQALSTLSSLNDAKDRFFANITHEFRTPITVILGMTEELTTTTKKSVHTSLQLIQNNASRLLQLVNQLLDLSKIDQQQLTLQYTQANVILFIKQLIVPFQHLAKQQNKALIYHCTPDQINMDYDAQVLQTILSNLLSNALKFTVVGGQIELEVTQKEQLHIEVKDDGIGMTIEQQSRIFERFYQADHSDTRLYEGSGIGMALVKELVDLLEGTIQVKSKREKALFFRYNCPSGKLHPCKQSRLSRKRRPSLMK